jgi:hypothetical protein
MGTFQVDVPRKRKPARNTHRRSLHLQRRRSRSTHSAGPSPLNPVSPSPSPLAESPLTPLARVDI